MHMYFCYYYYSRLVEVCSLFIKQVLFGSGIFTYCLVIPEPNSSIVTSTNNMSEKQILFVNNLDYVNRSENIV